MPRSCNILEAGNKSKSCFAEISGHGEGVGNCPIKPETMQNKLDDDLNVSELITIRCMDDTMVCECLIIIKDGQTAVISQYVG